MVGSRPCSCECEPGRDPCRINHCSLHLPPFLALPSLFLRIDRSCSLPDHSDNCSAYHSLFQPLRIILLPDRGAEDEQYQKTCKHAGRALFWLIGTLLAVLEPALILFTVGLTIVGTIVLGAWVVYALLTLRDARAYGDLFGST